MNTISLDGFERLAAFSQIPIKSKDIFLPGDVVVPSTFMAKRRPGKPTEIHWYEEVSINEPGHPFHGSRFTVAARHRSLYHRKLFGCRVALYPAGGLFSIGLDTRSIAYSFAVKFIEEDILIDIAEKEESIAFPPQYLYEGDPIAWSLRLIERIGRFSHVDLLAIEDPDRLEEKLGYLLDTNYFDCIQRIDAILEERSDLLKAKRGPSWQNLDIADSINNEGVKLVVKYAGDRYREALAHRASLIPPCASAPRSL